MLNEVLEGWIKVPLYVRVFNLYSEVDRRLEETT